MAHAEPVTASIGWHGDIPPRTGGDTWMPPMHVRAGVLAELRRLIRRNRVALLTTRDEDGALFTWPMVSSDREFDGELWFVTAVSAPAIDHIHSCGNVQVAFPDCRQGHSLVLDGMAHVCRGAELAGALWQSELSAILPRGPSDRAFAFIRVRVVSGDIWE